jgi:hypothetical protein
MESTIFNKSIEYDLPILQFKKGYQMKILTILIFILSAVNANTREYYEFDYSKYEFTSITEIVGNGKNTFFLTQESYPGDDRFTKLRIFRYDSGELEELVHPLLEESYGGTRSFHFSEYPEGFLLQLGNKILLFNNNGFSVVEFPDNGQDVIILTASGETTEGGIIGYLEKFNDPNDSIHDRKSYNVVAEVSENGIEILSRTLMNPKLPSFYSGVKPYGEGYVSYNNIREDGIVYYKDTGDSDTFPIPTPYNSSTYIQVEQFEVAGEYIIGQVEADFRENQSEFVFIINDDGGGYFLGPNHKGMLNTAREFHLNGNNLIFLNGRSAGEVIFNQYNLENRLISPFLTKDDVPIEYRDSLFKMLHYDQEYDRIFLEVRVGWERKLLVSKTPSSTRETKSGLRIYPTVINLGEQLNIDGCKNCELFLTDINGRQYRVETDGSTISLANVKPGNYYIGDANQKIIEKIIIKQ